MSDDTFVIISGRTVAEVCQDFKLQEEARAHLSGEPTPEEFVERLVKAKLYADATRFIAYALPDREAVWWACLCLRSVPACYDDDISTGALQAAEAWVKDPIEVNRKAALEAGNKHKFQLPAAAAAWAAMAAGWSGGASAAGGESVPAFGEHLTAHAASGAIMLAANAEPERAADVCQKFLETGVQIAQGRMQVSRRPMAAGHAMHKTVKHGEPDHVAASRQIETCEACGESILAGAGTKIDSGQILCGGCLKELRGK